MKKVIVLVLGALFLAAGGGAGAAEDGAAPGGKLPLNGDFVGAPTDASPVTGWVRAFAHRQGSVKLVPTRDRDKFMLELQAPANDWYEFVSDFIPVDGVKEGERLQVKATISGTGEGGVGWEAYESSQANPFGSLSGHSITHFISKGEAGTAQMSVPGDGATLPPKARFVRVRLLAGAGSTIRFADVRATINAEIPRELPLNSHFRGAFPAPGWTLAPEEADNVKVVPTATLGKFALEVRGGSSVLSDFIPLDREKGDWLKVTGQFSGTGLGHFGWTLYDASRKEIYDGGPFECDARLGTIDAEINAELWPRARFVRVELAAMPKASIRFSDVDATVAPAPGAKEPAPAIRVVKDGASFPYDSLTADEHFAFFTMTQGSAFKISLGCPGEGAWDKFSLAIDPSPDVENGDCAAPRVVPGVPTPAVWVDIDESAAPARKIIVSILPRAAGTSRLVIGCRDKKVTVHCIATKWQATEDGK